VNALGVGTPAGPEGYILATNNITSLYSDKRLKENIKNIDDSIEKIQSMTGVYFTQNKLAEKFGYNNYKKQIGLIAQQISAVFPEAVSTAPFDADDTGNSKSGENYLTINYDKLVPLLVEAIKEQQKEIRQLLQKIG
jgi:septal ring factor EnvC (AmiA/AmiB activator)